MNSVEDISKKILECSQNERLEILISLRAFLLECQDSPWIIFKDQESYTKDLISAQNNNIEHFKLKNERNIKRINIKEFANISNQIYESSLCTSRKNKIKDYWIHIWGIKDKYIYQYQSTIENLIL